METKKSDAVSSSDALSPVSEVDDGGDSGLVELKSDTVSNDCLNEEEPSDPLDSNSTEQLVGATSTVSPSPSFTPTVRY